VDSAVNWVDLDRRNYIETGLLEAQSKAPSTRKQVDSDWPWHL